MDPIKTKYKEYFDKWVRIYGHNGSNKIGVLKDADSNWINLNPSLINESLGNDQKDWKYRLEHKLPTIMKSVLIETIEPLSDRFIKELLERYPTKEDSQLSLF